MTNKVPEVGKPYIRIAEKVMDKPFTYVIIKIGEKGFEIECLEDVNRRPKWGDYLFDESTFWDSFEELPEAKAEAPLDYYIGKDLESPKEGYVEAAFDLETLLKFGIRPLDCYQRLFVRIPEDKAETKPETQSHISKNPENLNKENSYLKKEDEVQVRDVEKAKNNLRTKTGFDPFMKESDMISQFSSFPSNVEKAKENLRFHILVTKDDPNLKNTFLLMSAQALLDALDIDFTQGQFDELGKKNFKILRNGDIVEEMQQPEPKSIWKDVNKLPEIPCDVIISYRYGWSDKVESRGKIFGYFQPSDKIFASMKGDYTIPYSDIESFATLTDFINEHNDMQKRLTKLENK